MSYKKDLKDIYKLGIYLRHEGYQGYMKTLESLNLPEKVYKVLFGVWYDLTCQIYFDEYDYEVNHFYRKIFRELTELLKEVDGTDLYHPIKCLRTMVDKHYWNNPEWNVEWRK